MTLPELGGLPGGPAGKLPLWYRVEQSLRACISRACGAEPLRLPTEAALATHYDVSVATVRRALTGLEAEGLVTRHRRRGTFAVPLRAEPRSVPDNAVPGHVAAPVTAVLRDMLGVALARIENVVEATPATPEIAALLDVAPGSPVLLSTNVVRDRDGEVVDVAVIHYRGDRFRFGVSVDPS